MSDVARLCRVSWRLSQTRKLCITPCIDLFAAQRSGENRRPLPTAPQAPVPWSSTGRAGACRRLGVDRDGTIPPTQVPPHRGNGRGLTPPQEGDAMTNVDETDWRATLEPMGGFLRCGQCGRREPLGDTAAHTARGWPKCCGYTMTWWTQRQIDAGEAPDPNAEGGRHE